MQVTIIDGESRVEDVKSLFLEYAASIGIDLAYQHFQEELHTLPGKYAKPDGRIFLALVNGVPAGCIAMRRLDDCRAEMKRLYVRPSFRGQALGRALAQQVISAARECGYQALALDTLATMAGAQALYRTLGFVQTLPYYDSPVAGTVFLQLTISSASR